MWRVLWDGRGYKKCAENSLKYGDVGPDLVITTSADGGRVADYSTDLHPTSTSPFFKRTSAYGDNVTDLCTE